MAPARRKRGATAAAAAAEAAARWKVGDLVLAKMKGFPAWPAMISEPEQWGRPSVKNKRLVYFYGTKQIAFCNYAELEAFTEEKKRSLLAKRHGKGADFVRAVDEIIDVYDSLKQESNNKLDLAANEVEPGVENLADNNSSLHTEGRVNSCNMGTDRKLEDRPVTARGHNMVNADEPSVILTGSEQCVVNSAPDEPTENISILDEMRNIPLSTISFSKKKLRDAHPQNCYTRSRAPSLRRSRSSLSVETRKVQDSGFSGETSLASVDLVPDDNKEDSTLHKDTEDDKGNSGSPSTPDGVCLHSSGGTFNQPGTPRASGSNKKMFSTAKVDSNCNSETSQNGASETEFKSNGTSSLPVNTTVIFKRKRRPNKKWVPHSTDCTAPNTDEEFQAELSGNLVDSPTSKSELNKSDGDEHLPLVKRARVRMGRPQLEDSPVTVDVPNNKPELADECDMHGTPAPLPSDNYSADRSSVVNAAPNQSSMLDMPVLSGEGHPVLKNKGYQPKVLTLDVEAALPPSKRLHRALEAMSANVAETISSLPQERSNQFVQIDCVSSENSHSNKAAYAVVTSPGRYVIGRSPGPSSTQFVHGQTGKRHTSESIPENKRVPDSASVPSEAKDDNSRMLTINTVCEEIHMDNKKNTDCSLVCHKADSDVSEKASVLTMKLNEPAYDVTQTKAVPDWFSSSLGKASGNEVTKPINCNEDAKPIACLAYDDRSVDSCAKPFDQIKLPGSDNNVNSDSIAPGETVLCQSAINVGDATSTSSLVTKSSSIQSDADTRTLEVHTFSALALKELNHRNLKDRCTSPDSMPMKELIAVAQARRFSRSTSFPDNFLNGKYISKILVSTPPKEGPQRQLSPLNQIIRPTSTNDSVHSRSPFDSLQQKGVDKLAGHNEANAAHKAFAAFLGTLTRTKENISRATRLAIECAKHGIAGEAIDTIVERMEKETNLYKRVDLFFLVDSITQCSRNQKGGAGDVYPSLIQAVLPRLLYAAGPPGNSAWENRRQCLKVLKLWLERRTLPEYIIHHHIKELEVINEASFGSSRRPSRTERALNDPLRDNEGMLVDEYGSNAGFHIPDLICTKVLEDEEGSSSEDRSFEAVTPEQDAQDSDEKEESQMPVDKHRRILEEVDGDLEMEDVAPPSEAEANTTCQPERNDTNCTTSDHHPSDIGPPLPDDRPPSPPPLPSSPPPVPIALPPPVPIALPPPVPIALPPPPVPIAPSVPIAQSMQFKPTLQTTSDPVGPHHLRPTYNVQSQQPHSTVEHPGSMNPSVALLQPPSFCNSGYGVHSNQIPPIAPLNPPAPHGNFPTPPAPYHGNNYHQHPTASRPNEGYHLQRPPPPPPSNQFPYMPPEPHQRPQQWSNNNCSSYPERYQHNGHDRDHHKHDRLHHGHDRQHHFDDRGYRHDDRGHHFDDRGQHFDNSANRAPMQNGAPYPPGPPIPDHFETSPAPTHYGRSSDPPPGLCAGWSREPPVPHVAGAHGSWRPR